MNLLLASVAPVIPIIIILFPGLFLINRSTRYITFVPQLARAILWSVTLTSLTALLLISLSLPPVLTFLLTSLFSLYLILRHRRSASPRYVYICLAILLLFLLAYFIFSLPFLSFHRGLPTGDAQKSIYWANHILANESWPNYSLAISQLNRDPVDFYTPALHALTASVMQASVTTPVPEGPASFRYGDEWSLWGLRYGVSPPKEDADFSPRRLTPYPLLGFAAVGFLAIALALAVAVIAAALAAQLKLSPVFLWLPPLLLLTHPRFLRYLREPGYHLQNAAGELLLFGCLFLLLALIQKPNRRDTILLGLTWLTLILTHQFSAFLAAFILLPPLLVLASVNRQKILASSNWRRYIALLIILFLLLLALFRLAGLNQKIPHLFNHQPHLLSLTPNLADYLQLMGSVWFVSGLLGLAFIFRMTRSSAVSLAFFYSVLVLLFLSQAPRFNLDIPPIRALLYTAVPLSITAAFFIAWLLASLYRRRTTAARCAMIALLLGFSLPIISSVAKAYDLSHTVRTNSTFLPEFQPLLTFLQAQTDDAAVLLDDFNRRSSSWLILAGHPAFSRLASDLKRQMDEAKQSSTRRDLYLQHLDFEKIYALGSRPELSILLHKYRIQWLVGVNRSSATGLAQNPILRPIVSGGDLTIFSPQPPITYSANWSDYSRWLIRPTTLVNDLGDDEDTFLHLPASLRATRLSPPQRTDRGTYRTTTAPLIPLYFNVNTYVAALWDQDQNNIPDTAVQLSIKTMSPTEPLRVSYAGATHLVPADGTPLTIPAHDLNLSLAPWLIFTILNPSQAAIELDLIALGLSRT